MAILTYHHIGDSPEASDGHHGLWVSPSLFEGQLRWLRDHRVVDLPLAEVAHLLATGKPFPRRWVSITFDDGFLNNLTLGLPLLQQFGYSATIFMVTDKLRNEPPQGSPFDYMSAQELQQLAAAGITIGSHTCSHPRLTKLNSEHALRELTESRNALATVLGAPPDWFCYPYGNFSPRIADLVKQAGYKGALSTIRDNRLRPHQMYWLPRVMVMNNTTPERLDYMLSRWYHYVHAWKNRKRWKSLK